jgi:hypothetical protein
MEIVIVLEFISSYNRHRKFKNLQEISFKIKIIGLKSRKEFRWDISFETGSKYGMLDRLAEDYWARTPQ